MNLAASRIAIVGVTGVVGREILSILESLAVPPSAIVPLASPKSVGTRIPYSGSSIQVREATPQSFVGCRIALFASSSAVARELAPHAVEAGATVIDNSSEFRMRPGIPLVVPEINGHSALRASPAPKVIANPNCSTIILLTAIEPLRAAFGLRSVHVATYQAVSGAGRAGLDALKAESQAAVRDGSPARAQDSPFVEPCFFNVFSHNSAVDPSSGLNGEERKIIDESRKILGLPSLELTPTCVRVPVERAHSQAISLRLEHKATETHVREAYASHAQSGVIRIVDDRAGNRFPTPLKAAGQDHVLVGRIRPDPARPVDSDGRTDAWCLFACGDQLRKGAALNAVQIAEELLNRGIIKPETAKARA